MKKYKVVTTFILLTFFSGIIHAQKKISLYKYSIGDYLSVKGDTSYLREGPDSSYTIIDTIVDSYNNLSFKVLGNSDENKDQLVHVQVNIQKWLNGRPDKRGWYELPRILVDGKTGWVSKREVEIHPVPDQFGMSMYADDSEMLLTIAENCDWKNSNKDTYQTNKANAYFMLGAKLYKLDSLNDAIYFLSNSINIFPKKQAYILRAIAKGRLQDYNGSISDCNAGIFLMSHPDIFYKSKSLKIGIKSKLYIDETTDEFNNDSFYRIRGICYQNLKKYYSATIDFTTAIKENPKSAVLFYDRGESRYHLKQKDKACKDFSRAGELGMKKAYEAIKKYCH